MGKRYKTTLKLIEGDTKILTTFSRIYKKIYNKAIDIQLHHLSFSPNHELISKEFILETNSFECFFKEKNLKVDKGVTSKAVESAVFYFHKWWNKRLSTHGTDLDVPYTPARLTKKQGEFFATSSIIHISTKSYLYIPKMGERRLTRLHSIPPGSFKNVSMTFDGKRWVVSLESTIEPEPISDFLRDKIEIQITSSGKVNIEGTLLGDITKNETLNKVNSLLEGLYVNYEKVKQSPKDRAPLLKRIKHTETRVNNIKTSYYVRMVDKILLYKPRSIIIQSEVLGTQQEYYNELGILFFVKHLKKRAQESGVHVETLGATFEI